MAWFTRFTRFGDVHWVFGQEQGMTCGPASALMCYTKVMKLSPSGVGYSTTQRIQDYYAQWNGQAYDGSAVGTFPGGLVYALNQMNCGSWRQTTVSATGASAAITRYVGASSGLGPAAGMSPIIVGVNWDGSTGSHWVCIDTVRSFLGTNYATVCDPWDASVHVQSMSGGAFTYDAAPTWGVDFGGEHYEYSQPSTGRVRSWPIIHLTS